MTKPVSEMVKELLQSLDKLAEWADNDMFIGAIYFGEVQPKMEEIHAALGDTNAA